MPKVSVIVPVYNVEEYIREALDSLKDQTLQDIEIICVDDGSPDNSGKICDEYAAADPRFKVIHQKNAGTGAARNVGIDAATGEYIGFIDPDDYISKDYFEILYNAAIENQAELAATSCMAEVFKSETGEMRRRQFKRMGVPENKKVATGVKEKALMFIRTGSACNKIFNRQFINENNIRFPPYILGEDMAFNVFSLFLAKRVACTTKPMYCYRQGNSSSGSMNVTDERLMQLAECNSQLMKDVEKYNFSEEQMELIKRRVRISLNISLNRAPDNESREKFLALIRKLMPELGFDEYLKENARLIISITSFPPRKHIIHKTIQTLFWQKKKADKIVLWLSLEEFPNAEADLPKSLLDMKDQGLEIEWVQEDFKPYKKLVYALEKYPDDIIVNADDDKLYHRGWLKQLWKAHKKNPGQVICGRSHFMRFKKNQLKPYNKWRFENPYKISSYLNFFTGAGGVLYPPHVLHRDVTRSDLFMKMAPRTDDVWFWAMAVLNGTKIHNCGNRDLPNVSGTGESGLWNGNVGLDKNTEHIKNIAAHYPELMPRLLEAKRKDSYKVLLPDFLKRVFSIRKAYNKSNEKSWIQINILFVKIKLKRRMWQLRNEMKLLKQRMELMEDKLNNLEAK